MNTLALHRPKSSQGWGEGREDVGRQNTKKQEDNKKKQLKYF